MNNKTLGLGIFLVILIAAGVFFWQTQMQTRSGNGMTNAAGENSGGQSTAQTNAAAAPTTKKGAPIVAVTLPATLSEPEKIGKRVFDAKCATCHGENAAGQEGVAPPLVHKIYEPGHHGDTAFLLAARNGVRAHHWRFGNMPPVEGVTDGDVKLIVAYIRALQRANGIQ